MSDRLFLPAPDDGRTLTRRRFLQAGAATAGSMALLPSWLADMAGAATPLKANEGVVVVVLMGGGNDGLNTVAPIADGAYHSMRRQSALRAENALPIAPAFALHPRLRFLEQQWKAGQLAIVNGVGDPLPDLSHFSAMARWMGGTGNDTRGTGWLGRYVDGLGGGDDPFHSVVVGSSIPMTLVGHNRRPTALRGKVEQHLSVDHEEDWVVRAAETVRAMGAGPTGLGQWGDALAAAGRQAIDLTSTVRRFFDRDLAQGPLASQLDLCARVINADLGVRVLHVSHGSYDHHSSMGWQHDQKLGELDAGLSTFFERLSPTFLRRTTVITMSEFGRRPWVNASGGTDHGRASTLFALGGTVKGGFYGQFPSLSHLDPTGNLTPTVDFRSFYATVLDTALGADSNALLGGRFENLGFLRPPAA